MFEDKLNDNLTGAGFQRLNSNAQGVYLYFRVEELGVSILSVVRAMHGDEITQEQYTHILKQIKENFKQNYNLPVRLLSLILTLNPDQVKHLCASGTNDSHWIVDLYRYRLMIYETQAVNFSGLDKMIEQLLDAELQEQETDTGNAGRAESAGSAYSRGEMGDYHSASPYDQKQGKAFWASQFTLVTTILIALNIVIYIITHYTNAFGTPTQMYVKGALSWYFVVNYHEYYRFITAMFMHANLEHIFGNMLVLLFLGASLERTIGRFKYILIYFGAGILAGLASFGYNMWQEHTITIAQHTSMGIGASGAIFGVVGALLYIILVHRGYHNGISAVQVIIFTALNIYNGVIDAQIDQAAHVGGFIAGFLLAFLLYRKETYNRVNS